MKFPNKIIPYSESSLPKMVIILKELEHGDVAPSFLYEQVKKKIPSHEEFIEILSCLYAINKVKLTDLEELHLCW